jgi:large subunit ribosomal protein L24
MANKKSHVKKGDTVVVLSGADRGVRGEILEVIPSKDRAVVSGVRMVTKHKKATENDPGGRIEQEAPIHISNLMLIDPKTGTPTKTGRRIEGNKLVRFSKKTNEIID